MHTHTHADTDKDTQMQATTIPESRNWPGVINDMKTMKPGLIALTVYKIFRKGLLGLCEMRLWCPVG